MKQSFFDQDIRKILNLWRGKMTHKKIKGKDQLEMEKKYRINVGNGKEKTVVFKRVLKIAEAYQYLTVEGQCENIHLKATVRPDSMKQFEQFCMILKSLEDKKIVETIA